MVFKKKYHAYALIMAACMAGSLLAGCGQPRHASGPVLLTPPTGWQRLSVFAKAHDLTFWHDNLTGRYVLTGEGMEMVAVPGYDRFLVNRELVPVQAAPVVIAGDAWVAPGLDAILKARQEKKPEVVLPRPFETPTAWRVSLQRKWDSIVIHHSATPSGNIMQIDRMHRARGWEGIGYDFVICNGNGGKDGEIQVTYRWTQQKRGAHAGINHYNKHGIGICLIGNFENNAPSKKQTESLRQLVRFLMEYCQISGYRIFGHKELKATLCPGRLLPLPQLKKELRGR